MDRLEYTISILNDTLNTKKETSFNRRCSHEYIITIWWFSVNSNVFENGGKEQ